MNPYVARALGAIGAVLGIVAIWVEFAPGGATYWDLPESGHALAIDLDRDARARRALERLD